MPFRPMRIGHLEIPANRHELGRITQRRSQTTEKTTTEYSRTRCLDRGVFWCTRIVFRIVCLHVGYLPMLISDRANIVHFKPVNRRLACSRPWISYVPQICSPSLEHHTKGVGHEAMTALRLVAVP